MKPLKGSDYFSTDSATSDEYNDTYFDPYDFVEYLENNEKSGILTAPVYLDPNIKLGRSMTDTIESTR